MDNNINIMINGQRYGMILNGNVTATDLDQHLPLDLDFQSNGEAYYASLPVALTNADTDHTHHLLDNKLYYGIVSHRLIFQLKDVDGADDYIEIGHFKDTELTTVLKAAPEHLLLTVARDDE
ncbi:cyclophilin-like fold protein [Levilactobacillus bambusae]|uniref:Cyclophilin-like domain-containing protein n=1 Tax=Levilactobacillus bambusae TaxID=2024736 RepID=A0A2V1MZR5_9LACO|nr:cyclophilin-like fold protein [Levilactobacillus bambusae]PWG00312.1 hypothetical protein DCM90_05115 [Levilactobacillus bambusae]